MNARMGKGHDSQRRNVNFDGVDPPDIFHGSNESTFELYMNFHDERYESQVEFEKTSVKNKK
ncbi:MAG TPA: hypothetical protein DCQ90_00810 [Erysipelotrichaceae bacterium]|nr:hypothetical protein [Erysipelotrichaceae bacterium]